MVERLQFSVEKVEFVKDNPNSQFAEAKIMAFASSKNRHDLFCSEDTLQKTAPSLENKPLLYSINKTFGDFDSHKNNPGDNLIAGFTVPGTITFERLGDGRLGCFSDVKIWKRYSPQFMNIVQSENKKSVSVEMDLLASSPGPDNLTTMDDFEYTGVCVLGDLVTEAVPGANMQMVSFAEEQKEYQEAYNEEFAKTQVDFSIPKVVKENAQTGLDLYKKHAVGGSSITLATARHLAGSEVSNSDKVKHISKTHSTNQFKNMKKSPVPSPNYVKFLCYGGAEGKDWSDGLCQQMAEADNQLTSYFGEKVTFPYTDREGMNPSLKGIDPPITVAQGNEIAKIADGIGADKNGWPIAISQWKKSHVVKDGHWVKKENMEDSSDEGGKEKMSGMEDLEKKEVVMAETPAEEKKEDPAEEKAETPAEEKQEQKKEEEAKPKTKKMSLDANLDVAAMLAMLEDETEKYQELVQAELDKPDDEADMGVIVSAMFGKMSKMSAMCKGMAEENAQLKAFKADVESKEFQFAVNSTLKEIENAVEIPEGELAKLREESTKYSIVNIDAWKNYAKATGFNFASKKESKEEYKRIANPWANISEQPKGDVWARLGK